MRSLLLKHKYWVLRPTSENDSTSVEYFKNDNSFFFLKRNAKSVIGEGYLYMEYYFFSLNQKRRFEKFASRSPCFSSALACPFLCIIITINEFFFYLLCIFTLIPRYFVCFYISFFPKGQASVAWSWQQTLLQVYYMLNCMLSLGK